MDKPSNQVKGGFEQPRLTDGSYPPQKVVFSFSSRGERRFRFKKRREKDSKINHEHIYKEMKEAFGLVPSFFKLVPEARLEHEWELFKAIQMKETAIPNKYKELIGAGISGAVRCRYCSLFHPEMAKLNEATDAEIEEAVHYAKSSAGWSTDLNGMQVDYDQFKKEIHQACEQVRENARHKAA